MRPEAARVRFEIGSRLLEAGGSAATFRSQDAPGLLGDARRAFEQLDLVWDLARLEQVLRRDSRR